MKRESTARRSGSVIPFISTREDGLSREMRADKVNSWAPHLSFYSQQIADKGVISLVLGDTHFLFRKLIGHRLASRMYFRLAKTQTLRV